MHIIGIEGSYGSGKTTTAVVKATQWAQMTGAKLFTNFPMRGAYLFNHYEDWYRVAHVHGSIIIFDEAVKNYDSRQWANFEQTEQTKVLNYVRKLNSVIIFILPDYNDLESRIRNKTDIIIHCAKDKNRNIINSIYDCQFRVSDKDRGRLINKWRLPLQSQKYIWSLKLFNTHSMVHNFPTPPKEKTQEFYYRLDFAHQEALKRLYGDTYIDIGVLSKDDLNFDLPSLGGNSGWKNLRTR